MFKTIKKALMDLNNLSLNVAETNNLVIKTKTEIEGKIDSLSKKKENFLHDNIVLFISEENKKTLIEMACNSRYIEALEALFAAFKTATQCTVFNRRSIEDYNKAFDGIQVASSYLEGLKVFNKEYHDKKLQEMKGKEEKLTGNKKRAT